MNSRLNGHVDRDDLPVELWCPHCRRGRSLTEMAGALPTDDPLVSLECPGCGAVLDIGPHAW